MTTTGGGEVGEISREQDFNAYQNYDSDTENTKNSVLHTIVVCLVLVLP